MKTKKTEEPEVPEAKKVRASPVRNPHYEIARLKTERSKLKERAARIKAAYEADWHAITHRLETIESEILEAETKADSTNQEALL